jgi:tetratricopeptide (TPR) repeat protein
MHLLRNSQLRRPTRPRSRAGRGRGDLDCAFQFEAFAQSVETRVDLVSAIAATYAFSAACELWDARDRDLLSRWPTLALVAGHACFLLARTDAAAQNSKLSNVDLCNGKDRISAEPQIVGCTALIKSDENNARVLAIAYNNRGNAYAGNGQYELAIQDYDESIKLNPNYAKTFNNRGVA